MKPTCECGRLALFRQPKTGRVISRKDHAMCLRCWRAATQSAVHTRVADTRTGEVYR